MYGARIRRKGGSSTPARTERPLALILLALGLLPTRVTAQAIRNDLWMPDGQVNAVAVSNNIVYVGGTFTHVGPPTGAFVGLDPTSGSALQPYPLVGGGVVNSAVVWAIAADGNGGFFIGG